MMLISASSGWLMGGILRIVASLTAGRPPGCLAAAGGLAGITAGPGTGAASGPPGAHGLALAALASWLITEGLGAYMLATWIASGGPGRHRARHPGEVPTPVIIGHAGLAFTGFGVWLGFAATGARPLPWLALAFLTPAIGLGISTVTVWTPYPARRGIRGAPAGGTASPRTRPRPAGPAGTAPADRAAADPPSGHGRDGEVNVPAERDGLAPGDWPSGMMTYEMLTRALADQELTGRLVDDLLARMLAEPEPPPRQRAWNIAPLVAAGHGLSAF